MSKYKFQTLAPFTTRGQNFPADIIRLRRTSLVVSPNIMERYHTTRSVRQGFENTNNPPETVRLIFHVDKKAKVVMIEESKRGYAVQIRQNGAGYLNTTRIKFALPIGDYEVIAEDAKTDTKMPVFKLAV